MRKDYRTAKAWADEHPAVRMLILMTATGKTINWHTGTEAPEGRFVLLGIIE